MREYEFTGTNELSEQAFDVYSNSDFTFWKDGETFYCSDNPKSEKYIIGTLKDVEDFLLQFA